MGAPAEIVDSGHRLKWWGFLLLLPALLLYSYSMEQLTESVLGPSGVSTYQFTEIFGVPLAGLLALGGYLLLRASIGSRAMAVV
jgi:hypothetical protein